MCDTVIIASIPGRSGLVYLYAHARTLFQKGGNPCIFVDTVKIINTYNYILFVF